MAARLSSRARSSRTAAATSARSARAWSVRETLDTIRKIFPLRTCSDTVFRNRAPALHRVPDQALPGAVLLAGRPRRVRDAPARTVDAASRARTSSSCGRSTHAHGGGRGGDALRGGGAAPRPAPCDRDDRRSASRLGALGRRPGRVRPLPRGRLVEVQVLFVRAGKLTGNQAYTFDDLEFSRRRGAGGGADAVLPGRPADSRRDRCCRSRSRTPTCAPSTSASAGPAGRDLLSAARRQAPAGRDGDGERAPQLRRAAATRARSASACSRSCGSACISGSAPKRIECFDISTIQGSLDGRRRWSRSTRASRDRHATAATASARSRAATTSRRCTRC